MESMSFSNTLLAEGWIRYKLEACPTRKQEQSIPFHNRRTKFKREKEDKGEEIEEEKENRSQD